MRFDVKINDDEVKETLAGNAMNHINEVTSKIRGNYITPIEAQPVVYTMKADEAKRFLDDEDADLSNYPLIAAEIGLTAPTANEVALVYLHMSDMFVFALAELERIRLEAVYSIENATTRQEINNAVSLFDASIEAAF